MMEATPQRLSRRPSRNELADGPLGHSQQPSDPLSVASSSDSVYNTPRKFGTSSVAATPSSNSTFTVHTGNAGGVDPDSRQYTRNSVNNNTSNVVLNGRGSMDDDDDDGGANTTVVQLPARGASFLSWNENETGSRHDETEDDEDQLLQLPQTPSRYKGGQRYERVQSGDDDEDDDGQGSDDAPHMAKEPRLQRHHIDYDDDDVNTVFNPGYDMNDEVDDDSLDAQRRTRTRRVYGGGARFASGSGFASDSNSGTRGILSTSWRLFSASIGGGMPLLIAYAYGLTGLAFGIPLTIALLVLGTAFSPTVLTVEARYVGARTYASLAGAALPQIYGLRYVGECMVHLVAIYVSAGRTLIALYIVRDLVSQLSTFLFPRAQLLQSRLFLGLVLGLSFALPRVLLLPTLSCVSVPSGAVKRRGSGPNAQRSNGFLANTSLFTPLLYPFILLIVGVSLKNLDDYPSLLKPSTPRPPMPDHPLHTPSLWSGVSILLLLSAGTHGHAFSLYRQLRRNPTSAAARGSRGTDKAKSSYPSAASSNPLQRVVARHAWECSVIVAAALVGVVLMPIGSVGYASLLHITPDLFGSFPIDHSWFNFARILVLLCILSGIRPIMRPAESAGRAIIAIPRRIWLASPAAARKAAAHHKRQRSSSALDLDRPIDDEHETDLTMRLGDEESATEGVPGSPHHPQPFGERSSRMWEARAANALIYGGVTALLCTVRDLGAIAEIVGGIGSAWYAFILPALLFIILFHIRRPRTIFLTDASAPAIQQDTLLLQKEKQLQKKLMGKRIWIDLATFGLLLPAGIVGFARGIWALAQQ